MPVQKGKLTLYSPVRCLQGIGPKMELRLTKLGIFTVQDLLFHFPNRFQNKTQIITIDSLLPGEEGLIFGQITDVKLNHFGQKGYNKKQLLITINDETGTLQIRLFAHSGGHTSSYEVGSQLLCFGRANSYQNTLQMIHPEIDLVTNGEPPISNTLTPIYPTTHGLHQKTLRNLISSLLNKIDQGTLQLDLIPEACTQAFGLSPISGIIASIHFPTPQENTDKIKQQISIEELTTHHLNILSLKRNRMQLKAPLLEVTSDVVQQFIEHLPFTPTADQVSAIKDVHVDLSSTTPMLRLIQGDVGCGKTVIAAFAALCALLKGHQVALMAPTEILANQHFETLSLWLAHLQSTDIRLLTSKTATTERKKIIEQIKDGKNLLLIGTHALYQKDIIFSSLGLVIIDEQHRFGVEQRQSLVQKDGTSCANVPHQLILSATPIPRTLAMSIFSCMDISTIKTLPLGRRPTKTAIIPVSKRGELLARIKAAAQIGHQTFWVCPLIEEPDNQQAGESITSLKKIEEILKNELAEIPYSTIHGKMSSEKKQLAIDAFRSQQSMILLATTVIEVGVNIPSANIIVIEHADRFGLAQLHQLRGRVGRGNEAGYCVLIFQPPLNQVSQNRLSAIRDLTDGFEIAEQDLSLRGPGEVLGTDQTGAIQFKVADITRDNSLLVTSKKIAEWILSHDQNNTLFKLNQRWLKSNSEERLLA